MSGQPGIVKTPWSDEEIAILERVYPTGGSRAVQKLLPHRTLSMIRAKTTAMQLLMPGRKTYRRQPQSEWIDAAIKRAYSKGSPNLSELSRQLDRSKGWLKWRAGVLGVRGHAPGKPSSPWLPAEMALLDDCMDQGLSITAIHNRFKKAGFKRALTAIRSRIEQIGLSWHREYWTAADVARALGVTDRASLDWIHDGKLKAKRERGPGSDHLPVQDPKKILFAVRPQDVKTFMLKYPEHWDHRKMNKEVLVDLLSGGEYGVCSGAFGVS